MRQTVSREAGVPLEKKSVKKCSKEWLKLLEEEKELESCMSNLETQRDKISADASTHYPSVIRQAGIPFTPTSRN
jgi:hypothetical protein